MGRRVFRMPWGSWPATVVVLAFIPFAIDRFDQAMTAGSILRFDIAWEEWFLKYNQDVLYGSVREKVKKAQQSIPAGEPVIAWINTPFHLDFARNPIYDLEPAGLTTPWAKMPSARYLMVERGLATRPLPDYVREATGPGARARKQAAYTLNFAAKTGGKRIKRTPNLR
jgi:hypothetical protein